MTNTNFRPAPLDVIRYRPQAQSARTIEVTFVRYALTGPANFFVRLPNGESMNVPARNCSPVR